MKQFLKYSLIVLFFLILGTGSVWHIAGKVVVTGGEIQKENVCDLQLTESMVATSQVFVSMIDAFASIRQVEPVKVGGQENACRLFKLIFNYPKVTAAHSSFRRVCLKNFQQLLSERHMQGFYIYTLEKLII